LINAKVQVADPAHLAKEGHLSKVCSVYGETTFEVDAVCGTVRLVVRLGFTLDEAPASTVDDHALR